MKKILSILLASLIILATIAYLYSLTIRPDYHGKIHLDILSNPVDIYFDDYGVPHIYAQNDADLYRAMGYQHAQERLWQMELMRRIAPGRLAEVFGNEAKIVESDRFYRTLGIDVNSKKSTIEYAEKNSTAYQMANAYLQGINAFIKQGYTPIEYTMTGLKKTPFTFHDILNVTGYMSFSFAAAHRVDPWVTSVTQQLDSRYLQDLSIGSEYTQLIHSYPKQPNYQKISSHIDQLMGSSPVPPWIGSNSWVAGTEKTKHNAAMLANDPHINFSQPGAWYEAHLNSPTTEIYGYFLGVQPFAIIGHNRRIATGVTMLSNDDIDFFQEKINPDNPNQYFHHGQWKKFTSRQEIIKIKDADDITFQVKSSVHGPVINDIIDGLTSPPVTMWWTYTQHQNQTLQAIYEIAHAQSIGAIRPAAEKIHAAGLNITYADHLGNIAWWGAAKLVKRPHFSSKQILQGTGEYDPTGYYPFSKNPQAINPSWNYVYSANNQPDKVDGKLYPGYYQSEDRAKRIVNLLESNNQIDVKTMQSMIMDDRSLASQQISSLLTQQINADTDLENEALKSLNRWSGDHNITESAPLVYAATIARVMEYAMTDELGKTLFQSFRKTQATYKRSIAKLILNDTSVWWDNVKTPTKKEVRADIINLAFKNSVQHLKQLFGNNINDWQWGKAHYLEHKHAFSDIPVLGSLFNVGPFPVNGSVMVINNLGFEMDGDSNYPVTFGPSTRRIIDFSDINNSVSILPTGNSGNIFSPHYRDQAKLYANGKFRPMLLDENKIKQSKRRLVLTQQ